jgi:hypothetical protein
MYVCNNCGAHALQEKDIEHHPTCVPGEAKKWEEFYEKANEEEIAFYKEEDEKAPIITVYECVAGWKAKLMMFCKDDPDEEGYWDCWQTSYFAHEDPRLAIRDAKAWAEDEGLELVIPKALKHLDSEGGDK